VNFNEDVNNDEIFDANNNRLLSLVNATYLSSDDENLVQSWISANIIQGGGGSYYNWLVTFYSALCMLLGGNVNPVSAIEYWIHALVLFIGAILQAYIFGQVALLIADQNSNQVRWKVCLTSALFFISYQ
jgi:hypothetical protein